jgi:hypothetical protein
MAQPHGDGITAHGDGSAGDGDGITAHGDGTAGDSDGITAHGEGTTARYWLKRAAKAATMRYWCGDY